MVAELFRSAMINSKFICKRVKICSILFLLHEGEIFQVSEMKIKSGRIPRIFIGWAAKSEWAEILHLNM